MNEKNERSHAKVVKLKFAYAKQKIAYSSSVRPTSEFAAQVWDSYQKIQLKNIEKNRE